MYLTESNLQLITGYMAFNPELRITKNGGKLLSFKIVVSERVKGRDGNMITNKHYIECKAWGKTAENIAGVCGQGDFIQVAGKCVTENWEKDGKKVYKQLCEVLTFKNISHILNLSKNQQEDNSGGQSFAGGFNQPESGFGSDGLPSSFGAPPPAPPRMETDIEDDLEGIL